ncbi:MAG: CDP-diacylglycerol---glycerol-3-phosphate 3-phosphatidyltransferase [Frankiaceae bacterium]|jgi:CDP-diacylglycerol--glycerol-3-phosphate 3-phosphatidyltransferase|nr:CDP-diacylglycerol---glycerol-3-phosphate 3-phosphatidyltransferase [Frankiaceae bacterium]
MPPRFKASFFAPPLRALGRALARTPVTPDMITVTALLGTLAGAGFIASGHLVLGGILCWAFAMLDSVDGSLARARGVSSPWGALLDSTCDRVADGAIFGALVLWYATSQPWIARLALFCLVFGVVVSYVKARAEGLGLSANVGFAERAERLIIVLVGVILGGWGVPYVLAACLWVLAVATVVTIGQRLAEVRRQLAPQ